MGRVIAPFGVRGWLKVQPFSASAENMLSYRVWSLGDRTSWRECRVEDAKVQGSVVVAKLEGVKDREEAALYRAMQVAVPRDALPAAEENEFYWADLIGLEVINAADENLGHVTSVFETGANDVLVVKGDRERLIPFIEDVVRQVDIAAGVIRVEWQADY